MEAHEREPGGRLTVPETGCAGPVGHDESDAAIREELERLRVEPALVPELDGVSEVARERSESLGQPVVVACEGGR